MMVSCSGCLCDRYKGVGWEMGLGKDAVGHLLRCIPLLSYELDLWESLMEEPALLILCQKPTAGAET